jgi:PAS domain S-box-containing protein
MGLLLRLSRVVARMGMKEAAPCALQQAAFVSLPEAALALGCDGSVVCMNRAAESLLGCQAGEAAGFGVVRFLSLGGDPEDGALARLQRLADAAQHEEIVGWHRDGTAIPLEVSVAALSAAPAKYVIVLRDLRERRRTEERKGEFVATVNHELRTPLTSISGSLGLLVCGAASDLPDAALRLIRIAHANSQRLVRLVNDLLDMQKIESGALRFDIRPVFVRPLIEQAIEDTRPYAEGFRVTVELDPSSIDCVANADPDRLSQVVTNLISNAIKFSHSGGEVGICIALRGDDLRFYVRDRGEGIPEDFRHRIFDKFAQADRGDARHKGGSGLGLSIVQQIMIRMDGDVGFDSPPGGGTIFHVDLPLGTLPASDMPPIAPRTGQALPELAAANGHAA